MKTQQTEKCITVIIPTLNAEKHIAGLLDILMNQSRQPDEIIVADSESSDRTTEICQGYPPVKLLPVRRQDFDHGATRDMALRQSRGDIVIFMTQDAEPADDRLIENLIRPLEDESIAVSFGRQLARPDAGAAEKLIREFNYPAHSFTRSRQDIKNIGIRAYFLSDVCAAYNKSIYMKLGGFDYPLKSNEDMFFAARALRGGYKTTYCADAAVWHSHKLTWREQYERNRVQGFEISRHKELLGNVPMESEGMKLVSQVAKGLIKQGRFLSLGGFIIDCSARFMGSRRGRKEGR